MLCVLVTGAAGLVGGEVAGLLAERGHAVVALVHRATALRRNDGRPLDARPWRGGAPAPGGVAILAGDLRRERLGLEPADHARLAGSLDLVVHCAAVTGFDLDPVTYGAVNVEGTARVLALAEEGGERPVPLLHVSTAYVCGGRDGPIGEAELDVGQSFGNGYEASKAAAERLVEAARGRGLLAAVARPSVVVGAWPNGVVGRFGDAYAMIRVIAEGRVRVVPAEPGATLDLVPIDHVAGGLVDIAERMDRAAGRNFHLVSGTPVPVGELVRLARSYPQLSAPRFVAPAEFDSARLSPIERWRHEKVTALFGGYLRRDPRFGDANLRALSGRACPPTDFAYLRRMIDYCVDAGFLPGEHGRAGAGRADAAPAGAGLVETEGADADHAGAGPA